MAGKCVEDLVLLPELDSFISRSCRTSTVSAYNHWSRPTSYELFFINGEDRQDRLLMSLQIIGQREVLPYFGCSTKNYIPRRPHSGVDSPVP